ESCHPVLFYENTYFVDNKYGNDNDGVFEVIGKPFKTIQAAINEAVNNPNPNVTVKIRSGVYTEDVYPRDGIDLYFEDVELNGTINCDQPNTSCSITGNLTITGSTAFYSNEAGNNILLDIKAIKTPGYGVVFS